ncbi:signal transduction histidine kinase [Streptomyces sp. V1I1]|nr:nitrate- and nitrite sensing domain-containing protein [Streptomyces sp. V1I1]MDQ0940489.1 signal transduction histidine kinase [Streptomyces sp. V1I1]
MTSSAEQQARGNFTPPPRTAASPADAPGPSPAPGSSSRLSPRNWRVPTRLNAILLIPVLVGLVMGGFQVKSSIDTWDEAQDAEKTALIVRAASEYGQALLNERDLTAATLLTATSEADRQKPPVTKAYETTDAAKKKFDLAIQDMPDKQGLDRRLSLFRAEEPTLAKLRLAAYTKALDPVKTEEGYVKVQHSLMEFSNELGLGTGNITSYGRTVYAVQLAKAAASLQRSIGMHLLVRPSADDTVRAQQTVAFNSYNYLEQIAIGEYVSGGTQADTDKLKQIMAGKAAAGEKQLKALGLNPPRDKSGQVLAGMAGKIGEGLSPKELKKLDVTPETWMGASTAKFDGYTEIENELVDKAVTEAAAISDDAKTDAITNGGIVVIALLTAFILAGLMARQMSRSMRQLRTAAFGIAEQRLPMLVDQLSRTEPGRVDTRVQPIPIDSQDEIGEVARAFDQVHREAVRLAAEQAMLRGNVNAIFTNLSRRNQSLIEGQLTLITDLENNEADPDQLENLFKLDHLATRMRRNGENLLVLAGEEPGRRWNQPVPLVDVLRAASSEVESYERIELTGVPETDIHGQAVTDLVHLLAELLENATTFSSPQTKVRVTATRLPDGRVMIEIHDKGIGLTAEDFADINHKLANPPTVDAAVSQRMGLFVVGRLADRHGIRVQLRPSGEQAGTTSLVMLPDAITHGGGGQPLPEDDFTVSQIIPEQQVFEPAPIQSAPMRTAAELGFDDSRYEDSPKLDPVGRSLMREERRAALEAQAQGGERPLYGDETQYPQEQQQYASEYGQEYAQDYAQEQPQAYDGYQPQGGYQGPQEHQESAYAEATYQSSQTPEPQYDGQFDTQSHQAEWPEQGTYQSAYEPEYRTDSESAPGAPTNAPERVGFERPGPSPSSSHALTDAGLPRRGGTQQPQPQQQWQQPAEQAQQAPQSGQAEAAGNGAGSEDWRSTNDQRWQRAEKLREPKAGGVTPSGLPRRVPKANLVEGTAEQTPQGGPQVSRAPEDVRGRLSNLRRGVQQGRSAGTDTNGPGFGSGSTYNQER